jgi:hypothetical protein
MQHVVPRSDLIKPPMEKYRPQLGNYVIPETSLEVSISTTGSN